MTQNDRLRLSGAAAGAANTFFGGGGGMVLLPLLSGPCQVEGQRAYATCVATILPLCALSAAITLLRTGLSPVRALPYLLGGLIGGALGGRVMVHVPVVWLRRIFAVFTLYGSVRYLL